MHRGRQQRDPYAQLGVSRAATPAEINAAYRKLVRALHPDSADTPTEPSALHAVIDAHRILGDPEQRQAHDQSLDTPTPARASARVRRPCPLCRGTRMFHKRCERCEGRGVTLAYGTWLHTPTQCWICNGDGYQETPCRACGATGVG